MEQKSFDVCSVETREEHNIPTPEMVFTNDIDEKIGHPCFQANSMLQIMLLYMAC
jgi:hypothetical protein